jgi:acetyl-CoA acetyltransferase
MSDAVRAWIQGVGMTPFERSAPGTFAELGQRAVEAAAADARIDDLSQIDEVVCGTGYGGPLAAQRIAGPLGLSGVRTMNVENACSSGVAALALGVEAIASRRARTVLVIGIDKLSALGRGALPLEPSDAEVQQGMVMPALYAMRARRYLHETEATIEDLALVSAKARRNGVSNPYALMREVTTVEGVLESRVVADPLTLLMCCPRGDGAAAAVLSLTRPRGADVAVGIRAVQLSSGAYKTGPRDMARSELSERTVQAAYRSAGIGPHDVHVAEVHDAFSIAELMYYEALGFAQRGRGWELIRSGATERDGRVAVNPGGGLLARSHPVGATGMAQICEACWQLTGRADGRQVTGATNALTHCTGGGIAGFDHGACGVTVVSAG